MMNHKPVTWGLIALFILWLFFSIASYYVVHKPLSPEMVVLFNQLELPPMGSDGGAVGRAGLDILVVLWMTGMAWGAGLWLWEWLAPAEATPGERGLFSLGIGFGVLGLVVLFLGLVGWLETAVFYTLSIFLTLLALTKLWPLLQTIHRPRPPRLLAIYLAVVIGLALTVALLPPTNWDGLFYHLKGPKIYLEMGQIRPGIDIPHLNFPSLFEMLFMMAMVIRGDVAAQLLHFVFQFLVAGMVYLMARQVLQVKNSWTAVAFFFATPMVLLLATWTYNDLPLAFYSVAALYTFLRWQSNGRQALGVNPSQWLILSGIFSGLAMSLKYTSFITPLFMGCCLLWGYRREMGTGLRPLLAFVLPAVLVAAPWYVKNSLFTGNPVYPFVFGGQFWDGVRAAAYSDSGTGIGFDPIALLRLPYDLMLGIQDASQDGFTGPLYVAFLPVLLVYGLGGIGRQYPAFRYILLYALSHYAFWVVGVIFSAGLWQARLLLPCFVALCPALAWVMEQLQTFEHPQFSTYRFLHMAMAFVLLLNLIGQVAAWLPVYPLAYLSGGESREAFLQRQLGAHYAAMTEINAQLPPDAVVAFLWEPRSYYCDRDCRPDSILDEFDHLVYLYQTAPAIAQAWHERGVTHILIFRTGLDFLLQSRSTTNEPLPEPPVLTALQESYLEPVFTVGENYYQLFQLK